MSSEDLGPGGQMGSPRLAVGSGRVEELSGICLQGTKGSAQDPVTSQRPHRQILGPSSRANVFSPAHVGEGQGGDRRPSEKWVSWEEHGQSRTSRPEPRCVNVVSWKPRQLCARWCSQQRLCVRVGGESGCVGAFVHSACIQHTVFLGRKLRCWTPRALVTLEHSSPI